jgi:TetR/AcrR family transcriptional regulator, transcriptional repressor for nem operon
MIMPPSSGRSVRADLLATAQKLFQQRGYHAVSYYDLARSVGVKTATIHYYFPTKADLATALVARYTEQLQQRLDQIAARAADPFARLEDFSAIFVETYQDDSRMCLGGMFAADVLTLPPPTQEAVRFFFRSAEAWLTTVLAEGAAAGVLRLGATPNLVAQQILALLEGTLLITRALDDAQRLHDLAITLRALVGAPAP